MTQGMDGPEKVLLNDFRRQWREVGDDALAAVRRVGESGWYVLGAEVESFEASLAAFVGRRHVIGCANGLDAIEIGLRSLGVRRGDRVLTTPLSAFATTLAIVRSGGVPVFVDVDEHGLMDLDLARSHLAGGSSCRFVVPVHLYGHALDLSKLAAMRQDFDVRIVEDCAQAVGASWSGSPVGSVGEASALSFYPTKNLGAFGDGGAILTDDATIDASSRALRDYGQTSRYEHQVIGLNSRLDELHSAVLRTALLPRLAGWTSRRRAIASAYVSSLDHAAVTVPGAPPGSESAWHLFPVLVPSERREHFRAHLARAGVSTAVHYPRPIPQQAALGTVEFELAGPLTRSESYCSTEVSLPIHPYMTDAEVERVIAAVNGWRPS